MIPAMRRSKACTTADFRPFRQLAAIQQRLAWSVERTCAPEVSWIIQSRCSDPHRIEGLLDSMLSFCFDERVLLQFKKLCRHYYRIDPITTTEYVRFYRRMWEEPEPPRDPK